jgi:hypothetical protein
MNINEILKEIYDRISNDEFKQSINLINKYDIRVENYFLVNILDFLENLKQSEDIKNFNAQYHVQTKERKHIDLILTDKNLNKYYIELKHFSISKKKTSRDLKFYTTNNGKSSKDVGIINDVDKLIKIKKSGTLPEMKNLICFALITPKPEKQDVDEMLKRFKDFDETKDWTVNFPVPYNEQKEHVGIFYLSKNFKN